MTKKIYIIKTDEQGYGYGVQPEMEQPKVKDYIDDSGYHAAMVVWNNNLDDLPVLLLHPSFKVKAGDWISEWVEGYEGYYTSSAAWTVIDEREYGNKYPEHRRIVLLPKVEEAVIINRAIYEKGEDRGCPCKYLDEPCQPMCTCKNGVYSHGCIYCATYGGLEQRKKKAEWLSSIIKKGIAASQPNKDEGKQEDDTAIKMMDKAVKCLYMELPESIANDVSAKWEEVKKSKHLKP